MDMMAVYTHSGMKDVLCSHLKLVDANNTLFPIQVNLDETVLMT